MKFRCQICRTAGQMRMQAVVLISVLHFNLCPNYCHGYVTAIYSAIWRYFWTVVQFLPFWPTEQSSKPFASVSLFGLWLFFLFLFLCFRMASLAVIGNQKPRIKARLDTESWEANYPITTSPTIQCYILYVVSPPPPLKWELPYKNWSNWVKALFTTATLSWIFTETDQTMNVNMKNPSGNVQRWFCHMHKGPLLKC